MYLVSSTHKYTNIDTSLAHATYTHVDRAPYDPSNKPISAAAEAEAETSDGMDASECTHALMNASRTVMHAHCTEINALFERHEHVAARQRTNR